MLKKSILIAICFFCLSAAQNVVQAQSLWATIDQNELQVKLSEQPDKPGFAFDKVKDSIVTADGKTLTFNPQDDKSYLAATFPSHTNIAAVSNTWGVLDSTEPGHKSFLLNYYAKAARTLADAADPAPMDVQWYVRYQYGKPPDELYLNGHIAPGFPMIARLIENGQPVVGAQVKIYSPDGDVESAVTDIDGKVLFDTIGDGLYGLEATQYNNLSSQDKTYSSVHNYTTLTFNFHMDSVKGFPVSDGRPNEDIAKSLRSHVFNLRFSPNSKELITDGVTTKNGEPIDNRLRVWNVSTGKEICRLPAKSFTPDYVEPPLGYLSVLNDYVGSDLIMPDFKTMYSLGFCSYLKINIHSFHVEKRLSISNGSLSSIKLSPDGKLLAIGATRNTYIIDVKTHKMLHDFGHEGQGTKVFWGPHSKTLLCMWGPWRNYANKPQAVDVATAKQIHYPRWVYRVHGSDAFVFSPTGNYLAKATGHTIEIWETPTATSAGKKLNTFTTSIDIVRVLQFSPNGKTLAVGGSSKTKVPVQFFSLATVRK